MNDLPNLDAALLTSPDEDLLEPTRRANHPPRILLLYGSLRERSYSRFLTLEDRQPCAAISVMRGRREIAERTPRNDLSDS